MTSELPPAENSPLWHSLEKLCIQIQARLEGMLSGRFWFCKATLAAVLYSLLFSGALPLEPPTALPNVSPADEEEFADVFPTASNGFHSLTRSEPRHSRQMVSLLGSCFSLPPALANLLALAAVGAVLSMSCLLAFQITGDRVCALGLSLLTATTRNGAFGCLLFQEALALSLLLAALLPKTSVYWRGLLFVLAACCDERSLLLIGAVWLASLWPETPPSLFRPRQRLEALGIVGSVLVYALIRWGATGLVPLKSSLQGTGWNALQANAPFFRTGFWFALQGGWVLFLAATGLAWVRNNSRTASALLLAMGVLLAGNLVTPDFRVGITLVFPAVFLGLKLLAQYESRSTLRLVCMLAFILSAAAGDFRMLDITPDSQPLFNRGICEGLRLLLIAAHSLSQ